MEREQPKQRERVCAARTVIDGASWPCEREGVIRCHDGQWRCLWHADDWYVVRGLLQRRKSRT